jgi:flagellar hook protein FlgE
MNSIGNNLANVNTTGYKTEDVQFMDMLSETLQGASAPNGKLGGVNPDQVGLGVTLGSIGLDMSQGSANATNRPSDVMVQGNGMFVVSNGTGMSYTRDGSFTVDAAGNLVMRSNGMKVVGYPADATGKIDTTKPPTETSTISIPYGEKATAKVTANTALSGNLNGNAASTDTYTTQIRTYDAMGGAHDLTIVFSNRQTPGSSAPTGATSAWDWKAYEGDATTGTPVGDSTTTGNEQLFFDANGKMVSNLATGSFNAVKVPASNGASEFSINVDFKNISQLKSASSVSMKSQDGYPSGTLQSFSIGQDGIVSGVYSNGQTKTLAQLALANFVNPGGLEKAGGNLWGTSANSGSPIYGTATSTGFGKLSTGYLEQSNVDISKQFTDLIVTQRGFQANTKIVTTVDELLQEVLNLKR